MRELDQRGDMLESEDSEELRAEVQKLQELLEASCVENGYLKESLEAAQGKKGDDSVKVAQLEEALAAEKRRAKDQWKWSCSQVSELDALVESKDEEIAQLRAQLAGGRGVSPATTHSSEEEEELGGAGNAHPGVAAAPKLATMFVPTPSIVPTPRRGKAPPVDAFSGENDEIQLDDWLPALERASSWNGWSEGDQLLQLAGHLHGKALQEWGLIDESEKKTFPGAVNALRQRLDPGSKTMAAQEFRHTLQKEGESVASYIRQLERNFRVAYGRDGLGGCVPAWAAPRRAAL